MDQGARMVEPKNYSSSSDRTRDETNMDIVEGLKQQVLELKKKLKKNKNIYCFEDYGLKA